MQKIQLVCIYLVCLFIPSFASDLIVPFTIDGTQQKISIYKSGGQEKDYESAYNLLYSTAERNSGIEKTDKRWHNGQNLYPWVIFELKDIYTIDRIVLWDVYSCLDEGFSGYSNISGYRIHVSTYPPDECVWHEVAAEKNLEQLPVKDISFDPVEARYIKLSTMPGKKNDGLPDNAVRIYGVDIYGTFTREIHRESISAGKTILGYNQALDYYFRPHNILDWSTTHEGTPWCFGKPDSSDSLTWVIIDLEKNYLINECKLHDAGTLLSDFPNLTGYNLYVSTERPDTDKIEKNTDRNTCWTKVVDAYEKDRTEENIKTDVIEPVEGRYVKLEIPRSRTRSGKIFQLEVFGDELTSIENPEQEIRPVWSVYPNPVKKGENIRIEGETGLLSVYSLQGVWMGATYLSEKNNKLSTGTLPAGMYLLRLENDTNTFSAKLIVE